MVSGDVASAAGQYVSDHMISTGLLLRDPKLAERYHRNVEMSLIIQEGQEAIPLVEPFRAFRRGHNFDCLNPNFIRDADNPGQRVDH